MRLNTRLRRAEQAAAALPFTGPCKGCGGINTAKGCGWCMPGVVITGDDGTCDFMCYLCPRQWRGRIRLGPDGQPVRDARDRMWLDGAGPGSVFGDLPQPAQR